MAKKLVQVREISDAEWEQILNEVAEKLDREAEERGFIYIPKEQVTDPRYTERHDNPTPSGGDYSIAYYYDEDGHPCEKEKAFRVNIVEYLNDGTRINEFYSLLK